MLEPFQQIKFKDIFDYKESLRFLSTTIKTECVDILCGGIWLSNEQALKKNGLK